jgi:hypothetical protein
MQSKETKPVEILVCLLNSSYSGPQPTYQSCKAVKADQVLSRKADKVTNLGASRDGHACVMVILAYQCSDLCGNITIHCCLSIQYYMPRLAIFLADILKHIKNKLPP